MFNNIIEQCTVLVSGQKCLFGRNWEIFTDTSYAKNLCVESGTDIMLLNQHVSCIFELCYRRVLFVNISNMDFIIPEVSKPR